MGLSAAYELSKLGLKPDLYEADDRLGGMAACFDFENGKWVFIDDFLNKQLNLD